MRSISGTATFDVSTGNSLSLTDVGNDIFYNVEVDISEQWNRAKQHPELVRELDALARGMDAEITANARPVKVEEATYFDPLKPGAEPDA